MDAATGPPAPGSAPMKVPIREPRIIVGTSRLSVGLSGTTRPTFIFFLLLTPSSNTWLSISDIPKRPMSAGTWPSPPSRYGLPKVKRCWPVRASIPTSESSMPIRPETMPLRKDSPQESATRQMPKAASTKYSG